MSDTSIPVSYTHLDVYKRQVSDIAELREIFRSISHVSSPVLQPSAAQSSPLRLCKFLFLIYIGCKLFKLEYMLVVQTRVYVIINQDINYFLHSFFKIEYICVC